MFWTIFCLSNGGRSFTKNMHRKSAFSMGISNSNLACAIIGLQQHGKPKKKKKSKFRLSSTLSFELTFLRVIAICEDISQHFTKFWNVCGIQIPPRWFPDSLRSHLQIPDLSGIPNSTRKHFLDSGLRNSLLGEYLAFMVALYQFLIQ